MEKRKSYIKPEGLGFHSYILVYYYGNKVQDLDYLLQICKELYECFKGITIEISTHFNMLLISSSDRGLLKEINAYLQELGL